MEVSDCWCIAISFSVKQETVVKLQEQITKDNCCEASEQTERILQVYLILVKYAHGSKIPQPEDVCKVGQPVSYPRGIISIRCRRRGKLGWAVMFYLADYIKAREQRSLNEEGRLLFSTSWDGFSRPR